MRLLEEDDLNHLIMMNCDESSDSFEYFIGDRQAISCHIFSF